MATLIGIVSQVVGEVFAVAGDGARRPLVEGDRVYAGEQLVTGAGGAVAVTLSNGEVLTLGRDSSLNLNEQMLAGGDGQTAQPQEQESAAPSDSDLTDVEQLQAAIEAGVDPTLEGEATAAGPGAGGGGGAGGVGGGHSFVLLGEVGGALDPVIGFPTAGFNTGPEFPDAEPIVTADIDSTPTVEIIYFDEEGQVVTGPAVVLESALDSDASDNEDGQEGSSAEESNQEFATGTLLINSPDGISAIWVQGVGGPVNVLGGGIVQGLYGTLTFDGAGNWTYTLTDNSLDHPVEADSPAGNADDFLPDGFTVWVVDLDGDASPTAALTVHVYDDMPEIDRFCVDKAVIVDESVGWFWGSTKDEWGGDAIAFDEKWAESTGVGSDPAAIGYAMVEGECLFKLDVTWGADNKRESAEGAEGSNFKYEFVLAAGGEPDGDNEASLLAESSGVKTNLKATDGGRIWLFQESNGDLVGRDDNGDGDIVFRIRIDSTTGDVTLWQFEAINHGWDGNDHDSLQSLALCLEEGSLLVQVTAFDNDGDSATATADLNGVFGFEDDGPKILKLEIAHEWSFKQGWQKAMLVVDESVAKDGSNQDEPGRAKPNDEQAFGHPGYDFVFGKSHKVIGFASVDFDKLFKMHVEAGSDGLKKTIYELELNRQEPGQDQLQSLSGGVDSGLETTSGKNIFLYQIGGDVFGKAGHELIFKIQINKYTGEMTLVQYESIKHDKVDDHDELATLARNVLNLKVTVIDGDGDTDCKVLDIGKAIGFEDDGPSANIDLKGPWAGVTHDESEGLQGPYLWNIFKPGDFNDNDVPYLSVFNGVANKGSDLSPTGFARSLTPVVTTVGSDVGEDEEGATIKLSLEIVGGDGADSGLKTTDGFSIRLCLEGGLVVGRINDGPSEDQAAFAIAIGADGSISIAQYVSLHHPVGGSSHDEAESLAGKIQAVVTVTDGDKDVAVDTVQIGHVIRFEDDGPTAHIELVRKASVTHDESHGLQNATETPTPAGDADDNDINGISHLFNAVANRGGDLSPKGYAQSNGPLVSTAGSSFGEDQEGATKQLTLEIVGGSGTTLKTTAGHSISLYLEGTEGNLVVGRINAGPDTGKAAFAITIGADGTVSIAQYVSLYHPLGGSAHDDVQDLAGKLKAVVTVTDGDKDVAVDKVSIGHLVRFEDDGPTANIDLKGPWAGVTHDESEGLQGLYWWNILNPEDLNDNDVTYLSVFNGVVNKGSDLSPAGFARSLTPVVTTFGSDVGEDEEGATIKLSLEIVGNADSGLETTDGHSISLHLEGGLIVGRIDDGSDEPPAAFAIAIGADGSISIAQYVSLHHPVGGSSYDEAVNLNGKIQAVVTVTDGDKDVAVDTVQIGHVIRFEDDGPSAGLSLAFVDEDGDSAHGVPVLPDRLVNGPDDSNYTVATTGKLAIDAGEDGLKSVAFAEGTAKTIFGQVVESGGNEVKLEWKPELDDAGGVLEGYYMDGDDVRVPVFTLTLAANNLDYTFALHQPLDHNAPGTEDELYLKLEFTATDGDDDTAKGMVKVVVDDDTPVLNGNTVIEPCLTVTYMGGDAGYSNSYGYYIKGEGGVPTTGAIIWANLHSLDEIPASTTVSGLNPEDVGFFIIPNGAIGNGVVEGYEDGAALTFVPDGDGWQAYLGVVPLVGAGGANVLFDNPLLNPTDDSHTEDNAADGNQNWEDVHVGGDNDFNDVNVQVQWKNLVHEDKLSVLDAPIPAPYEGNEELSQSLVATGGDGTLLSLVNFGADGPGKVSLITSNVNTVMKNANPGLTSGGESLFYSVSGGVLTAYAGIDETGTPVFSLSVTEEGGYTFTLLGPLDHNEAPATDNDFDTLIANAGIDFTRVLKITDYDGDPVDLSNASGRFVIRVEDDAPIATCDAACFTEQAATTNILMAFDFSNSMFFEAGGDGQSFVDGRWVNHPDGSRFEAIFTAVQSMFAAYDAQGDVNIRIVGFSSGNTEGNGLWTSAWFSSATEAAQWLLDTFNDPGRAQPGGTNYEDALDAARAAWEVGTPTEGSNVAYFITDGYANGGDTLDATGDWTSFLTEEGFVGNYVVAVGGSGPEDIDGSDFVQAELDAIAAGVDGEVILSDFDSIAEDLAGTAVLNQLEGNLVTGDAHGGVADLSGADGWLKDAGGNDVPLVSVKIDIDGDGNDEVFAIAQVGVTTIDLGDDLGTIDFYANGKYVYKAGDLPAGEQTLKFEYTVLDNDRTSSTACFELNLKGIQNSAPQVGDAVARVSEEGLSTPAAPYQGIEDEDGYPDASADDTNATSVIDGVISISDPDGDLLTVSLVAPAPGVFMSGGVPVVWSGDGTDHLVGTKGVGGIPILEVSVTADGHYSVVLKGPVDHPHKGEGTAGEDVFSYDFIVQVSDGTDTDEGKITVHIEDDSPVAQDLEQSTSISGVQYTNLMIILDVSGSMNSGAGFGGYSRLEAAKLSVLELLEQYESKGEVMVRLVTFSNDAAASGSEWMSVSQAKTTVLNFPNSPDGALTNYDSALTAAEAAWEDDGKLEAVDLVGPLQNVSYFLSDGIPNQPGGDDAGIQPGEEGDWIDFLTKYDITSYALGMGPAAQVVANAGGNFDNNDQLDAIAYDGAAGVAGTNTNAIAVDNFANLSTVLAEIAQSGELQGSMVDGANGFGADGGRVKSVTVNSITYTYSPEDVTKISTNPPGATFGFSGTQLTLMLAAGMLVIDMASGGYKFTPIAELDEEAHIDIGFTLVDGDGDYDSANLSLTVDPADQPMVVRDNFIVTNQADFVVPDWMLLANDSGPDRISGVLDVGGGINPTRGVGATSTSVTSASTGEFFNYTATDGDRSADGRVSVTVDTDGAINGTFRDEILIGGIGDDTLFGNQGRDILLGGLGRDTLNGGDGADTIVIRATVGSSSDSARFGVAGSANDVGQDTLQSFSLSEDIVRVVADNVSSFTHGANTAIGTAAGGMGGTTGSGANSYTTLTGLIDLNANGAYNDADDIVLTFSSTSGFSEASFESRLQYELYGTAGNDILSGGDLGDLIIGGLGNDVLAGGAGADTFRWLAGDTTGADKVLDFKPSEGDKLDLTQLLVGESYNAGSLDDFLSFSVVDNSTVISIAPTGAGAPTTTIELNGFNVAVEYGVTPGGGGIISAGADTATVINGLLGDNALQVA